MGREIKKVPSGFQHPKDTGGEYLPGAHHELLYALPQDQLTCFQIYENVSEGTPVSPIFLDQRSLEQWLQVQGWSEASIRQFVEMGHAPQLVIEVNPNEHL